MDPDRLWRRQSSNENSGRCFRGEAGVGETVGPFDPAVFTRYDARHQSVLHKMSRASGRYSDDQVAALRIAGKDDSSDEADRLAWLPQD